MNKDIDQRLIDYSDEYKRDTQIINAPLITNESLLQSGHNYSTITELVNLFLQDDKHSATSD